MSEIKLLPCPLCGGEAKVINESECGFEYYGVMCFKCGTGTRLTGIEPVAIDLWNTRKPMQEIVERLEEELVSESDYTKKEDKKLVRHWNNCVDVCKEIVKEVGGMNEQIQNNRNNNPT